MNNNEYKRTSRHLSKETKAKISRALTGRPKTHAHREAIRQGELRYWRNDSNFPDDRIGLGQYETTVEDLV